MASLKSYSEDQQYVIEAIMKLCKLTNFDADLTYGNGAFWKNIPQPTYCFDINPQTKETIQASSVSVPLATATLKSIMFDPPFLTYIKQGREHNSIMAKRFSGYWRYDELEQHYKQTISESHILLAKKGVLVIKCQDIIHNHAMQATHMNIVSWAQGLFKLKDIFVLIAKNRMPMPEKENTKKREQKHARIHHSYFLVLERT